LDRRWRPNDWSNLNPVVLRSCRRENSFPWYIWFHATFLIPTVLKVICPVYLILITPRLWRAEQLWLLTHFLEQNGHSS
jgi:hypothetical protein